MLDDNKSGVTLPSESQWQTDATCLPCFIFITCALASCPTDKNTYAISDCIQLYSTIWNLNFWMAYCIHTVLSLVTTIQAAILKTY